MQPAKIDTNEERPEEAGMEVSPLVELVIKRMEERPSEFYRYGGITKGGQLQTHPINKSSNTVSQIIDHTKALWNRKEKRLYNLALRKVRMDEAFRLLAQYIIVKGEK